MLDVTKLKIEMEEIKKMAHELYDRSVMPELVVDSDFHYLCTKYLGHLKAEI